MRAYAQLVRLPNVFTAMADIFLAALVGGFMGVRWETLPFLLLASSCLYCAGMVWNDIFDLEQDRRERPLRPLPSERIALRTAIGLGAGLMAAGILFALLAGIRADGFSATPVIIAGLLVGAIFLYDGVLKRTPAGPLAMGSCRFLNVLLGLTATNREISPEGVHVALVVGVYIVGVTWFARTEAQESNVIHLAGAALVMLSALALALTIPGWLNRGTASFLFPYLVVGLGFLIGLPIGQAIARPTPARVQAAVGRAIIGLVVLDAVLATAVVGIAGLVILVLLAPTLFLKKWIYVT